MRRSIIFQTLQGTPSAAKTALPTRVHLKDCANFHYKKIA